MLSLFTTLLLVTTIYILSSIRIANENERFAVITLGRFMGIKGPGLIVHTPYIQKLIKVALGAEGQIQSDTMVAVNGYAVPYVGTGRIRPGMKVRVSGFEPAALRVEANEQFVVCEKCGHKNAVTNTAF